jgi:hypothetical protein
MFIRIILQLSISLTSQNNLSEWNLAKVVFFGFSDEAKDEFRDPF